MKPNPILALSLFVSLAACGDSPSLLDATEVASAGYQDPTGPLALDSQDRERTSSTDASSTTNGVPKEWVELRWNGSSSAINLDLHVRDPQGSHIHYLSTISEDESGQFAPHPECQSYDCDGSEDSPSERIHWDADRMRPGTYEVWVSNDSPSPAQFELEFNVPGTEEVETASIGPGESSSTWTFEIEEEPSDCLGKLRARGVTFDKITISEGVCKVEDAVMLRGPVNGITYRYNPSRSGTRLRTACETALAIYDSAAMLKRHNIDTVYHEGSYYCRNKRSASGLSQHGLARAMDYAGFRTTSGTEYSVVRHWEHDTTSPRTEAGKVLRQIATGLKSYYPIVLDADHDSDHDDHFHGALRGR